MGYVKNITAHYRKELDAILEDRPQYARASSGRTEHFFLPDPDKTFHRGSTDYFVTDRKVDIGAFDSPTFTGLPVGVVEKVGKRDMQVVTDVPLTNGDGLNVLVKREVVASAPTSPNRVANSKKTARSATAIASSPTKCPKDCTSCGPTTRCRATSTTTGNRPCNAPPPNAGSRGVARRPARAALDAYPQQ